MATTGSGVTLDLAPIRAMVREELAAALSRAPGAGVQAGSSSPPAEVSSASPQQQQDAIQAISGLMEGGNWGNDERASFHQQLGQLDPQQREAAMQRLVQAINSGNLRVATAGAPF
jgi:hypothetical protein